MKRNSTLLVLIGVLVVSFSGCAEQDFPTLRGPYLGQEPPGKRPEIFAPGIISTGYSERTAAFTPDGKEFYFSLWGAPHGVTLFMTEENGRWTKPRVAPFSGQYSEGFNMSPDGNKIVVASDRPFDGSGEPLDTYPIWIVERTATGWGEPMNPRPLLTGHPTISESGTLYFATVYEGGSGGDDIYRSALAAGEYGEVENLGSSINTEVDEYDPFIARDESYLIFVRRVPETGLDLFISFRDNGSWTAAKNMGDEVNSSAAEICPSVSPDGKYLFFTSYRTPHSEYSETALKYEEKIRILNSPGNGSGDIYWVDAGIIEELKPNHGCH